MVFDASAKSICGLSLNDTLLTGPCTYPHINTVVTRFRRHIVGFSANISKMFGEVVLNRVEPDYYRFIIEDPSNPDNITICRMKRLTFGVACSPFLATTVLRRLAEDYEQEYPEAAALVWEDFYVDGLLTGAESAQHAIVLRHQLNTLLEKASMILRKWHSSNQTVLSTIPDELKEVE